MKCPNCGSALDQLGTIVDNVWFPENLYGCRSCPFGRNRFEMKNGKPVPIEPSFDQRAHAVNPKSQETSEESGDVKEGENKSLYEEPFQGFEDLNYPD